MKAGRLAVPSVSAKHQEDDSRAFRRRLGGALASTATGNAIASMCQWGVVVLLARSVGLAELGVYALALTVAQSALAVAGLQLRNAFVSDVNEQYRFVDYFALRLVLVLTTLVLVLLCSSFLMRGHEWRVLAVLVVTKGFEQGLDILYAPWHRGAKMGAVAACVGVHGVVSLAVAWGLLVLGLGVEGVVWGMLCVSASTFVVILVWAIPSLDTTFGGRIPGRLWSLFRQTVPLGVVVVILAAQFSLPRLALDRWEGSEGLALFAAVSQLTSAGGNVVSAVAAALSPYLVRSYANGVIARFRRAVLGLALGGWVLGAMGALLSAVVGGEILGALYGPEFVEGQQLLVLLSVVAGGTYATSFLGCGMTVARAFRQQVFVFGAGLLVLVSVASVAGPGFGMWGIVAALGAAALVQTALGVGAVVRLDGSKRIPGGTLR